jgi:hypothetical protein
MEGLVLGFALIVIVILILSVAYPGFRKFLGFIAIIAVIGIGVALFTEQQASKERERNRQAAEAFAQNAISLNDPVFSNVALKPAPYGSYSTPSKASSPTTLVIRSVASCFR